MSTTDINSFLLGSAVPAAKFETKGAVCKGVIIDSDVAQQTDFATKEPKFWSDGKPMMQAVITVQTDERDPDIADDDGVRKIYVKGQMQEAVRAALKAANAKIDVGGTIAVQYVDDEASGKGNPKKIYKAAYKPGAPSVDATNDLLGTNGNTTAASGVAASDLI